MKDGPRPMRNMRPSKRNRNAVDQFREEHEASYESRETVERTQDVDAHNAAYPKMRDELKRRRSTAKATVPTTDAKRRRVANEMIYDPHCPHCQRIKAASKMKPKTRRNVAGNGKRKQATKPRITKRTRKFTTAMINNFNTLQRPINLGTDETVAPGEERKSNSPPASQGTKSVVSSPASENSFWSNSIKSDYSVLMMSRGCQPFNFSSVGTSKQAKEPQDPHQILDAPAKPDGSKSDVVSRNPDTSENTLSSYNSNMSLDHEPMVSSP